jgi:uroporphyrinogen decarboxylase
MKVNNFIAPLFQEEILEDQGSWVLVRNELGMTEKRSKARNSLSSYVDGPVKNIDDWEKLKAERLRPTLDNRLPENWNELLEGYKNRTFPLALGGGQGFFGTPRFLLGEVPVLTSFYDQPELIKQIVTDLADFWIALYDQLLDLTDVDLIMIWEDICYNSGPLISPATFREYLLPGYKKLTRFLKDRGVKNIIVDTDGDVWKLLPLFVEGGVTGMYPFEVKAGMDVIEVRKAYPKLQMLGGISKASLISGKNEIDAELNQKIPWMLEQGGYIPYMDHLVPPEVSWDNFKYYRRKLNQLIDQHPKT